MEMLKIIIFEYLLGYILQGFSIILGVYALNRQKLDFKKYISASVFLIVAIYFIKLLPISFGVHTILNILVLYLICTLLLNMEAYPTVRSSLFVIVILLVNEIILVTLMILLLGKSRFEELMQNPVDKAIIGLPPSINFAIIMFLAYYILVKRKESQGKNNGNNCT